MLIRRETPADAARIDEVHRQAFAGPVEADLRLGVTAPEPAWGDHFQARPLSTWHAGLEGAFRYAAPFQTL